MIKPISLSRCSRLLLPLIAASTLFIQALGAAAAIPAPERLLPDDTLVVLTIPDFVQMRQLYKTSPQTQLWNDPAMQPFKEKFLSKWKQDLVEPLERDLKIHFDDYTGLPQGQVTLALTQNGWQGTSDPLPALLLLVDTKNKGDQLKKNLGDLRKKLADAGKTVRTEKIRGVDFWIVPLSTNDLPKTLQKLLPANENNSAGDDNASPKEAPKSELVVGQFESLLIVGNSTKAVEKVVVHLTGGAMPALGDLAAFESDRLAVFRNAPFYAWVNAKSFIDLVLRKAAGKDSDTPDPFTLFSPEKVLAASGFGGVKTLAFSFQNSSEGSFAQFSIGLPEGSRQGLFKLLPTEGKESGPPPFVPADVVKFQRWRIDGQKAWATLQNVMNDINPQLLNSLNFLLDTANTAAKEKDPNFDLRKSLFGNLGDDMISYEKAPTGPAPAQSRSQPSLFLLGSSHPNELANALKSIFVLMNQQGGSPTEREFLGRKIYSVPLPAVPLPTANPGAPQSLNYAATSAYVALSTDPGILEEFLRSSDSQQKALRDTAGLIDAAAKVGGTSTGWFGYENAAETTRSTIDMLKKNAEKAGPALPGMAFPGTEGNFKDWVDFSLLPSFDKISKYFSFTVYSGTMNANGLTFKMFAPVPPALKK